MLNKLKIEHNQLVLKNNDKVKEIEIELAQDLPSYKNLNTEINLNGLNESQSINLYNLKIKGLNRKLEHSEAFLIAVKANAVKHSW